jgi:hypothetical protein
MNKKDGTLRLCVDYRGLNKLIIKNKFLLLGIDDLFYHLHGTMILSKIDLQTGYHHIYVKDQNVPKTGFITGCGHYEFMVMPFILTNTLATFMMLMNSLF